MKTVIMAGGRGTRIAQYNADVPKPMLPVFGKPILEYQIECLATQGFTEIILVIGYLGQVIENYFGDGRRFGVDISCIKEEIPLGTAGALFLLKDLLSEDFLLLNGDIIFDVDLNKFCESHQKMTASLATILTHPNDHPFDSGVVVADRTGKVIEWLHKEDERSWYKNSVNAGLHILTPQILKQCSSIPKVDLDRDILKPLMADGKLFVYHSSEYIKDIGTPERLYEVTTDIQKNIPRSKNLTQKQKAIFLDRDGTINRGKGFLRHIDDFELMDGVAEAIRLINRSGYLAIVITNQPVVARGEVTVTQLETIHNKMETLLGNEGAYVDAIYYCPHHPDKGFAGEVAELKIHCDCRKPKPGMLLAAAQKYNIDLARSWMIGDAERDIEAGRNAGCQTAYVGLSHDESEKIADVPVFGSLLEGIRIILG